MSREKFKEFKLTVRLDGYDEMFDKDYFWPDPENIDYCGNKIPNRECDVDS